MTVPCSRCSAPVDHSKTKNVDYELPGLENITLQGTRVVSCEGCGYTFVTANLNLVNRAVCMLLIGKLGCLTYREAKWLRLAVGMTEAQITKVMCVSRFPTAPEEWLSPEADILLRCLVAYHFKFEFAFVMRQLSGVNSSEWTRPPQPLCASVQPSAIQ